MTIGAACGWKPCARTSPSVLTWRITASGIRLATLPPLVRIAPASAGKPKIALIQLRTAVLDVGGGVIAPGDAGIVRGCHHLRQNAKRCGRRIDPGEEAPAGVAHRVGQHQFG